MLTVIHVIAALIWLIVLVMFSMHEWRSLERAMQERLYKERQLHYYKPYRHWYKRDRLEHGRLRWEIKMLKRYWRFRLGVDLLLALIILSSGYALLAGS